MQRELGKHLLWIACRHHVGEVILTHVWDALKVEVSKGPEITIFDRLVFGNKVIRQVVI